MIQHSVEIASIYISKNYHTFPVGNFLEESFQRYLEIKLSENFVFQFGKLNFHILEIPISREFLNYFLRISKLFPENFQAISKDISSRGFPKNFQSISRGFPSYFQTFSREFPGLFERISIVWKCPKPWKLNF